MFRSRITQILTRIYAETSCVNQRRYQRLSASKIGLTFIEILIALAIIAIAFLPLMQMFSIGLEEGVRMSDLTTARYLAQDGMERLKNLAFTEEQLINLGNVWEPELNKPPLVINNHKWRVYRELKKDTNPLEVHIKVYEEPISKDKKPLVDLVTLVEDLEWTE